MLKKLIALSVVLLSQSCIASSTTAKIWPYAEDLPIPIGLEAVFSSHHESITTNETGSAKVATVCFVLNACHEMGVHEKQTKVCRSFNILPGQQIRQNQDLDLSVRYYVALNCKLLAETTTTGAISSDAKDYKTFKVR